MCWESISRHVLRKSVKCRRGRGPPAPAPSLRPWIVLPPHSYPYILLYTFSQTWTCLISLFVSKRCRHKAIPINYFVCRSVLCTVQAPKSICLNYPSWSRGWRQCTRPPDSYAKTYEKGRIVPKYLHTYIANHFNCLTSRSASFASCVTERTKGQIHSGRGRLIPEKAIL